MSGFAQPWVPGFDSASGTLVLPLWSAAMLAATVTAFCVFVLARAGREGWVETLTRAGLLLSGGTLAWIVLNVTSAGTFAAERRALDARWHEMTTRAAAPGLPLACLDATAGELVEASCEKALFASPEAAAASVAYVTAQLSLLADGSDYEQRTGANYEAVLGGLRHAIETDRFGIVAHVLADRDGCTKVRCGAFGFLSDTSRVSENMSERRYETIVLHYAPEWPQSVLSAVAVNASPPAAPPAVPTALPQAAPAPNSASASPPKTPNGLYFPSSSSIPPVSIMSAEPTGPAAQAAPADGSTKSAESKSESKSTGARSKPTASQPVKRPAGDQQP